MDSGHFDSVSDYDVDTFHCFRVLLQLALYSLTLKKQNCHGSHTRSEHGLGETKAMDKVL
eukprot:3990849-Amphidinium_carterae.1